MLEDIALPLRSSEWSYISHYPLLAVHHENGHIAPFWWHILARGSASLKNPNAFWFSDQNFELEKLMFLESSMYMKMVLVLYSTLLFRKAGGIEIIQTFNGKYLRLTGPCLILHFFQIKGAIKQQTNWKEKKISVWRDFHLLWAVLFTRVLLQVRRISLACIR